MRALRRALALATALMVLSPAAAHADFFAAVTVKAPSPRTDLDVAVVNVSTGSRVTLPSGVNTTADEIHPDITSNGNRLTFQRRDLAAGTTRIIVVNISPAGAISDLYTGFETAQRPPQHPSITPDGTVVADGGPFTPSSSGTSFHPDLTLTDVRSYPNPPYPRGMLRPSPISYSTTGSVAKTEVGGNNLFAQQTVRLGANDELILSQLGGSSALLARAGETLSNPAIPANSPQFVLFDKRPVTNGVAGNGDIAFRPASTSTFAGTPTNLPAIVNSSLDESQPGFTPDGRYVGFVRHGSDGRDRLFVWDSVTQTILNTSGVNLGVVTTRDVGKVSLYERTVFVLGGVLTTNLASAQLLQPSTVGILVQRIRGKRRRPLLGRGEYRLRNVGRIPLGNFRRRVRKRFKLCVRGRGLRRGRYLLTLRAVNRRRTRIVRDLGRSKVIRVRGNRARC